MNPPKRGRPRAYDPDVAVGRLMETFWTHGYAATSLDQIAEATGMNRPSLYAAFGDKKAMYRRAVENFGDDLRTAMTAALTEEPLLADALRRCFGTVLDVYAPSRGDARGCLAICTAPAEALNDPDMRADLASALDGIESAFIARFERARTEGDLPSGIEAPAAGRLAASMLHSLAIRARAGQKRAALQRVIDDGIAVILR